MDPRALSHRLSIVPETPLWVAQLIIAQQDMNKTTLAKLREHGLSAESTVRLDFSYDAPGSEQADRLPAFIRAETDYTVAVGRTPRRGLRSGAWHVTGTTSDTAISLDTLDDWVRWMVTAGAVHGQCRFDGWGTEAN